ncbi:MAG: peptidase M28, partial [Thermoanaerobaculia bacterium]
MKRALLFPIAFTAALTIGAATKTDDIPAVVATAMKSFRAATIAAHDKFLSSDLLEGRAPGTRGDAIAEEYIATQFESYGLKPGGENGTYFQKVPLVGVTLDPAKTSLSFTRDGAPLAGPLQYLDEFVGSDATQNPAVTLDSDVIFVGHGVVAPEYKWDDYKGVDVRGKVVLMFVNEPPSDDDSFFKGKALTYYGRWTYKYEEAARRGAVGAVL